ncbi:MAG: ribonuclease H-like domain-containing protein, partial [candidate division Zixibacteria bacterium]|nr:ribonuclease H-like domain-containing protein [candidate division Zixibacteria bacterium]
TETTGLGGSGAVAFLVGCGSVTENGFEVRQYLMPDYSDEAAMLEALQEEFSSDKTLVTYNGAAFDLPLLRGRMIVNRVARELAMADHLDLLHAARRLFRRRLGDCSLTNVERELFEFYRQDDVPGYLIPSIYFDWLGTRRLDGLLGVLEHNRLDIVSLWFLAVMVAEAFASDGSTLDSADDLHSLARVYSRRKYHHKVVDLCRRREEIQPGVAQPDVALFQAQAFKRAGEKEQAASLWRSLSGGDSREAYWANLELAKHFEHSTRDYHQALRFAKMAQRICPYGKSHRDSLKHRIKRLTTRIKG